MTTEEREELIDNLWEKHARADRHGYRDVMHGNGFGAACNELIDMFDKPRASEEGHEKAPA